MRSNHRFAFFGTDEVSVGVLNALKNGGFLPSLIITREDQPVGRKQIITPPPVKVWADENAIPAIQPDKFKNIENWPEKVAGAELAIVASYGKIIPKWVLDSFPKGVLNVHPSLLPKYRGPTPFQSALLFGEKETGVTIMIMDEEMDHGNLVETSSYAIKDTDTYATLEKTLSEMGGEMLCDILPKWINGNVTTREQHHPDATFTRKFTVEDGFIKPQVITGNATQEEVAYADRQVRALNPEPGTWTVLKDSRIPNSELRIKILSAKVEGGKLVPTRVVPAGKREMSWDDFKRGQSL